MKAEHSAMPHGGTVLRSGTTGENSTQIIEFGLKLDSNPEFTASVLVAYARAAFKLARKGQTGAKTVFDIPFGDLSPKSAAELRKELL
jgi:diaminopimelate dehydrogenase